MLAAAIGGTKTYGETVIGSMLASEDRQRISVTLAATKNTPHQMFMMPRCTWIEHDSPWTRQNTLAASATRGRKGG